MAGRNRTAVDLTIDALRHLGRLDQIDESLVAAAESLAGAVDAEPGQASLWRESGSSTIRSNTEDAVALYAKEMEEQLKTVFPD